MAPMEQPRKAPQHNQVLHSADIKHPRKSIPSQGQDQAPKNMSSLRTEAERERTYRKFSSWAEIEHLRKSRTSQRLWDRAREEPSTPELGQCTHVWVLFQEESPPLGWYGGPVPVLIMPQGLKSRSFWRGPAVIRCVAENFCGATFWN